MGGKRGEINSDKESRTSHNTIWQDNWGGNELRLARCSIVCPVFDFSLLERTHLQY